MNKKEEGYIKIITAELLLALGYIFARIGETLGNENLAFFRILLAAGILGLISLFYKKYTIQKIEKEKRKLLLLGALHGFIILASFISINLLTISSAVLLQSTIMIWMAILSILLLKEKPQKNSFIAIILSILGIIILINPSSLFEEKSILGILASLFVGIFGGLIYVISKTFKHYNKTSLTFWQNTIAVPFLIPLILVNPPVITTFSIGIYLALGITGSLAFVLLYQGISKIKGQTASVLLLLYAVFSIILAYIFFNEIPTLGEIIGGILILLGAYITTKKT